MASWGQRCPLARVLSGSTCAGYWAVGASKNLTLYTASPWQRHTKLKRWLQKTASEGRCVFSQVSPLPAFCSGLCSKCCNTLRLIFTCDLFFPWESDIISFFVPFSYHDTALPRDDLLYRWKASHRHIQNETEKSSKPCFRLLTPSFLCFKPRYKSSFWDKLSNTL